MKLKLLAIFLLVAIAGWLIPYQTVAKPYVFTSDKNKILAQDWSGNDPRGILQLHQQESVIHKTDAPAPTPAPKTNPKPTTRIPDRRDYPAPTADKEAVKALIIKYSELYGINPAIPLCIAYYESGFNSQSKNKSSSASGVFQYLSGTWNGTDEGRAGFSVFDAEANIKAAIKYMSSRKNTNPWQVKNRCPKL